MGEMRTFRLNKLVRDGIAPDIIKSGGEIVRLQLQTKEQKRKALVAKVIEEAKEFAKSGSVSEIADLQEAVDQLVVSEGSSSEEIKRKQAEKRTQVGGFSNYYFIGTVTLPIDNSWVEYYASDPEKYPEV
jgi:predicted house-cleaning noncanonical NTP pyrophosphatase (MazG superfamily)